MGPAARAAPRPKGRYRANVIDRPGLETDLAPVKSAPAIAVGGCLEATMPASPRRPSIRPWLVLVILALCAAGAAAATVEDGFIAENKAAMDRMMVGMAVKPTGDADRDFATMMIAHHQGAIDMAVAELHFGRNEQLRRIAQGIVVEQQQEIAAMRQILADPPGAPRASGEK